MFDRLSSRFVSKIAIYIMVTLIGHLSVVVPGAWAQSGISIEFDPVTAAIKGEDVTIHCQVSAQVDEVRLFIRKLLDLGPFNDLPMEKAGTYTWRLVLPLGQEEEDLGRLEYYLEAYKGGKSVAKTESYVISFVEKPFIGEMQFHEDIGVDKDIWKAYIGGRIKRAFFKRWWVWALIGAAGVATTAVLVGGGGDAPPAPPAISLDPNENVKRDTTFTNICDGRDILFDLRIAGGVPPFEAIFAVQRIGGSTSATTSDGTIQIDGSNRIILTAQTFQATGTFPVTFPAIDVELAKGQFFGTTNMKFSVVLKDGETGASLASAVVGSPVPSTILELVENDERVQFETTFDVVTDSGNAAGCR